MLAVLALTIRQVVRQGGLRVDMLRYVARLLLLTLRGPPPGTKVKGAARHAPGDASMRVPFEHADRLPPVAGPRIAVLCHVFHAELAEELLQAVQAIPAPADVIASTDTQEKAAAVREVFAAWKSGAVEVRVLANRGRDIGSKIELYRGVGDRYDLLLLLHSKRDATFLSGSEWRRHLLASLAGSRAVVRSILEAFACDPTLGVVMAQHWAPIRPWVDWNQDYETARALAARFGARLTRAHVVDFPSGSMFWARPSALAPLLELGLTLEDFPAETGQREGTPAHAVERLFLYMCEAAGYRWAKVAAGEVGEALPPSRIGDAADLRRFARAHGYRLLPGRAASGRKRAAPYGR